MAITINFAIPRVMPGNAVDTLLAKYPTLDANSLKALEAEFGTHTHGSLISQYFTYLGDLAHGNLGTSVNLYPAKVTTVIAQTLPWTVILVGTATIISFTVGTLLGIFAAWRRGGWLDRTLPAFTFLQATPYFFLALIAIELFAVSWGLFPFGQGYSLGLAPGWNWSFISSAIYHSILPALDDHRDLDGGLDAADAQRDDHDDRRGLRARRAGQGALAPPGDVQLRGPQRDPAQHRRVRAVARLRRRRRARDGDRVLLPGGRADRCTTRSPPTTSRCCRGSSW